MLLAHTAMFVYYVVPMCPKPCTHLPSGSSRFVQNSLAFFLHGSYD